MASSKSPVGSTVYIALWRDAASSEFVVLGAYDSVADANARVRRLGREQLSDGLANLQEPDPKMRHTGAEPLRWDTADGLSCWVESHEVKGAEEAAAEDKATEV